MHGAALRASKFGAAYIGAIGFSIAALVQFGVLPPEIDSILGVVLLFLTFYEVNIVRISLGPVNSPEGRVLGSISGISMYLLLEYGSGLVVAVIGTALLVLMFLLLSIATYGDLNWTRLPWKLKRKYEVAFNAAERLDPRFVDKDVLLLWGLRRLPDIELLRFGTTALAMVPYYIGFIGSVFLVVIVNFLVPTSFTLSIFLLGLAVLEVSRQRHGTDIDGGLPKEAIGFLRRAWKASERMDFDRYSVVTRLFGHPKAFLYLALIVFTVISSSEMLFLPALFILDPGQFFTSSAPVRLALVGVTFGLVVNAMVALYLVTCFVSMRAGRDLHFMLARPFVSLSLSALAAALIFGLLEAPFVDGANLLSWIPFPLEFRFYLIGVLGLFQLINIAWSYRNPSGSTGTSLTGSKAEGAMLVYVALLILLSGGSETLSFLSLLAFGSLFYYSMFRFLIAAQKWPGHIWARAKSELGLLELSFLSLTLYGFATIQTVITWLGAFGLFMGLFSALSDARMKKFGWIIFGVKEVEKKNTSDTFLPVQL